VFLALHPCAFHPTPCFHRPPPPTTTHTQQVSRCSALEEGRLSTELSSCLSPNPARDDLEAALSHLSSGQVRAFQALRGAVESCLAVSGGTELKGVLTVVDRSTQQYLVKLQATTGLLLNRCVGGGGGQRGGWRWEVGGSGRWEKQGTGRYNADGGGVGVLELGVGCCPPYA
jgi:hypothetical protein